MNRRVMYASTSAGAHEVEGAMIKIGAYATGVFLENGRFKIVGYWE